MRDVISLCATYDEIPVTFQQRAPTLICTPLHFRSQLDMGQRFPVGHSIFHSLPNWTSLVSPLTRMVSFLGRLGLQPALPRPRDIPLAKPTSPAPILRPIGSKRPSVPSAGFCKAEGLPTMSVLISAAQSVRLSSPSCPPGRQGAYPSVKQPALSLPRSPRPPALFQPCLRF